MGNRVKEIRTGASICSATVFRLLDLVLGEEIFEQIFAIVACGVFLWWVWAVSDYLALRLHRCGLFSMLKG